MDSGATMGDYRIAYDTATEISRLHDSAHRELAALAESMPTDIDGGAGADLLLSILGPIAEDAGSLASIQNDASARMATTVDLYRGIEEDAEEAFRKMSEAI